MCVYTEMSFLNDQHETNWCTVIKTVISHSSSNIYCLEGERLLILNNSSWAQVQTAAVLQHAVKIQAPIMAALVLHVAYGPRKCRSPLQKQLMFWAFPS